MAEATSTDDSPTSGYQLSEISRATKSSYQANTQIQQYLVDRLSKPNHNTKFKTLMIIKHVCRTGRPEFKREMGRNVDAIRECLQFKGPPDPLRGDEIYRRVRDCAREVLEALFDGQMPVVAAANRIQGMGNDFTPPEGPKPTASGYLSSMATSISSAVMGEGDNSPKYAGHPGATSNFGPPGSTGGGGGYDPRVYNNNHSNNNFSSGGGSSSGGFGNPNYADPRGEKTWLQKASELASSAASTAAAAAGFNKSDTNEPLQMNRNFSQPQSGTFNRAAFSNPEGSSGMGGYNYATNRGPNAIHANNSPYSPQSYPPGSMPQQSPYGGQNPGMGGGGGGIVPDMPLSVTGFGRAGGGLDNGNYEKNIIDSLCEPAGLRPVPPEEKLQDFLATASTLSEEIVGNCILDVLNDESWQSRTKALIVLAKLVKQADCGAHLQWWLDRADVIESLQTDPKANVRTQAFKTLRAIDPSASAIPPPATAAPAPRRIPSARGSFGGPSAAFSTQPLPAGSAATAADAYSEMGTTISEDGSKAISDEGDQAQLPSELEQPPEPEPVPLPPPPPAEMNLLGFDDYDEPTPQPKFAAPQSGIPAVVNTSAPIPVSPLAHEHNQSVEPSPSHYAHPAPLVAMDDSDSLFAGMSVGTGDVPSQSAPSASLSAAPGAAGPAAASTVSTDGSVFDLLNSMVDTPVTASAAAPTTAAGGSSEPDLFGSLVISEHITPVAHVAASGPTGPSVTMATAPAPMSTGNAYLDQFASLMDPVVTPAPQQAQQQHMQQQMQLQHMQQQMASMTPEQQVVYLQMQMQQMQMQGQMQGQQLPVHMQGHPQGLHLTRPIPTAHGIPGNPGNPSYGYPQPPRGVIPGRPTNNGMSMNGMPMNGMPMNGMPMNGTPMNGMPMNGTGPRQGIHLRQGASVIAPGMLSHTAERKNIPIAEGKGGSGFNFMGSPGQNRAATAPDSFSFVTDAMKAQTK
eukprot:CAMPEP_0170368766 /NCGR_PEP_ID=MMETSP0117_2-20130122/7628_1 /TAXON_ID=400756 /ORGANISM="Durinskia baltica, Strain CSIRO CS-38" /LENGTH=966 /DNA_ID=CAMNT_0010623447 /DNA_START=129 /DNA_END=3029 /DNA_ORIENTATION=+